MKASERIRDAVTELLFRKALEGGRVVFMAEVERLATHIWLDVCTENDTTAWRESQAGRDYTPISEMLDGELQLRGLTKFGGHYFMPGAELPADMQVTRMGKLMRTIDDVKLWWAERTL